MGEKAYFQNFFLIRKLKHCWARVNSKNETAVYAFLNTLSQSAFFLITPIYVLYLHQAGLDSQQITLVGTVFMLAVFLLEVPTGVIADAYGRKVSTIVGWLFRGTSFFIYFWANDLRFFLLGETVGAIGAACVSGAFTAWLRESTNYHGYIRAISKTEIIVRATAILLNTIASFLAFKYGFKNMFLAGGVLLFFTALMGIIFMKPDDPSKRSEEELAGAEKFLSITKASRLILGQSKSLKLFLLTEFITGVGFESVKIFWVIRFTQKLSSELFAGPLTAAISVMLLIGSWLSQRVGRQKENLTRNLQGLSFLMGIMIAFSALSSSPWWGIIFFFLHQLIKGIWVILQETSIQEFLPAKARAALTSLAAMVKTIGSAIGLTLAGFLVKSFNIETAWIVSGFLIMASCLIYKKLGLIAAGKNNL